ncbi:hypothetical protein BGZ94_003080, partial [Podila epigama]
MSGSAPTVKDLYKVITADFNSYLNESANPPSTQQPTIQQFLDRFIRSIQHNASTTSTSSAAAAAASAAASSVSSPVPGSTAHLSGAPQGANSTFGTGASNPTQQRHPNELLLQSLTNVPTQHPSNLPFAFHRISQPSSTTVSPSASQPTSQNASASGSPILSTVMGSHATATATSMPNSPAVHTTSTFSIPSATTTSPLAAQRFSAHLVSLFSQHVAGTVPIATVATRLLLYLTHLLPFLTPQLVMSDWWERLIEPSLQGEIKLEKDALKTCRDLLTECMIRDSLLDSSGSGSVLVAGDEEGQLDTSVAMATMPIPQFVLRKYIMAAHRLNHRLADADKPEDLYPEGSAAWLRAKTTSRAGHGSGMGQDIEGGSLKGASGHTFAQKRRASSSTIHELEKQQQLFSKARAIIRRKKDIAAKNLEIVLFAYGGNVNRVKDFFSCLYSYFVGARFRAQILGLLCQFIRRQRVHLHQILATPLFDSLLLSLKYDTSPLIVSLGLMTLIMLMPRIPAALNEKLPDLFMILARIITWPKSRQQLMSVNDQEGANLTGQTIKSFDEFDDNTTEGQQSASDKDNANNSHDEQTAWPFDDIEFEDVTLFNHGLVWRRFGPALPGERDEGAPDPTAIFTFLYGLFPNNLLKFLHEPRQYLSQAISPTGSPRQGSGAGSGGDGAVVNSSEGDGVMSPKELATATNMYLDEDLLKARVQTLLRRHSLHPDLLTLTDAQEVVNRARWQKLEPMEIVAMCVGLDVWSAGGPFGMGPILRSIEEDSRGPSLQESEIGGIDDDDEDNNNINNVNNNMSSSDQHGTHHGQKSEEKKARKDIAEAQSSEDSDTPMELLSQEGFFDAHVGKESSSRPHSATMFPIGSRISSDRFSGSHVTSGAHTPPRSRTRSKEVRMSQILRNFTTLRGLDHDNYLNEAASKSLGAGSLLVDYKRAARSAKTGTESTTHTDIPNDSHALSVVAKQLMTDEEQRDPVVSMLLSLTQEYRKTIVHLERDLLMAKNELNFELFLKQQHIQQISKIHRAHVLDASVEAERQNLYNTCRSLKAQLQETKVLLEKEKNELNQRKNKQTHWDSELKGKLQMFRDERKALNFEVERLKQEIQDTRKAKEIQERLLTEERKGTFGLRNSIEDLSPKLKRMEEYEKRIQEMTRQLVIWEGEQSKSLERQRRMETVVSRWQNLELLLAAEKEESRVLRNRVSQQSQIIDDMRIQLAMRGGKGLESMSRNLLKKKSRSELYATDDVGHSSQGGEDSDEDEDDDEEAEESNNVGTQGSLYQAHHRSYQDWPQGFSPSSGQTGLDPRRAEMMQEFMAREKERWDQELQQAHNRLSREAVRNQQLEDRILELQGQLEIARAIDVRHHLGMSGSGGGGGGDGGHGHGHGQLGPHGLGGGNAGGGAAGGGGHGLSDGRHMHGHDVDTSRSQPSQLQNVPRMAGQSSSTIHEEVETDDGGIDSSAMLGRYSRQNETEDDEDDIVGVRLRNAKFHPDLDAGSHFSRSTSTATVPSAAPTSSSTRAQKGKSSKTGKSKSRWLQGPSILERSQTDRGTYGLGSNPSLTASSSSSSHNKRSGDSAGSSSFAARAASGGLYPPIYTRHYSHISDG